MARASTSNAYDLLRGRRRRIDSNAPCSKVEPRRIRDLEHSIDPLELRRGVRRYSMQADGGPRHVDRGRVVETRAEDKVGRAVPPDTSVDAINVVRRVRNLGVDDKRLDIFGDDVGKGDSRSFDSRYVACRRRVLVRNRSWRGVNMYSKRTMSLALTCRAMAERGYTHSTPLLSRRSRVPVTALRADRRSVRAVQDS